MRFVREQTERHTLNMIPPDVKLLTHLFMEHVETEEGLLLQKNMFVVYIKLDRTQLARVPAMLSNML